MKLTRTCTTPLSRVRLRAADTGAVKVDLSEILRAGKRRLPINWCRPPAFNENEIDCWKLTRNGKPI